MKIYVLYVFMCIKKIFKRIQTDKTKRRWETRSDNDDTNSTSDNERGRNNTYVCRRRDLVMTQSDWNEGESTNTDRRTHTYTTRSANWSNRFIAISYACLHLVFSHWNRQQTVQRTEYADHLFKRKKKTFWICKITFSISTANDDVGQRILNINTQ